MRKIVMLFLVLALVVAVVAGCNPQTVDEGENKDVKEEVTLNIAALKGPTVIGMVKMFEDKPLLGEKVTCDYLLAPTPDVMVTKLVKGEVDIAALPTNLAATLYNKGIDYQVAAMNTWGVLYVLGNTTEINDWADLKGRSVYLTAKGTTPDIVFRYLAEANGINTETDMEINYMNHVELAQSLIAGKVNIACVPEPFVTNVLMKNSDIRVVMDIQEEWRKIKGPDADFAQTCLVIKKELLEKHFDIVDGFLDEYAKSMKWVNDNPADAAVLVEKQDIGIKAEVAEAAIPRCNIRYMDAADARQAIENFLQVLLDFSAETVGGKLPDDGFYYQK